jgi:flagellar FliL protein
MISRLAQLRVARFFLILACGLFINASQANDHGGGGGGGNAPMKFTTNVGLSKYLQFEVVLEVAKPEAEAALAGVKPKLQHQILLQLSDETIESLLTLEGKLKLQERIKEIANRLIDETPKTGVKEVLFTSFIIQ